MALEICFKVVASLCPNPPDDSPYRGCKRNQCGLNAKDCTRTSSASVFFWAVSAISFLRTAADRCVTSDAARCIERERKSADDPRQKEKQSTDTSRCREGKRDVNSNVERLRTERTWRTHLVFFFLAAAVEPNGCGRRQEKVSRESIALQGSSLLTALPRKRPRGTGNTQTAYLE